jgi:hypothetical protein
VEVSVVSVIDDLRSAQQQALIRLNELEPLVAEYEELRREVKRLGLTDATLTGGAAAPAGKKEPAASRAKQQAGRRANRRSATSGNGAGAGATPASKPATTTARRAPASQPKRSGSSARVDDIARLVAQRPGVTVAELGRSLGVEATGLYRPVRRLMSEGRLRKDGTALHPVAR